MRDPDSFFSVLWSSDEASQFALWIVLGSAAVTVVAIYGPLLLRLGRLFLLERRLRDQAGDGGEGRPPGGDADPIRAAMADSPIADAFAEFDRRWSTAQLGVAQERAPIRLIDVFEDKPLLPYGPRRSLLPTLPGLFLGLGVFAAIVGLIPSLSSLAADEAGADAQSAWLALQLGQALRATAWGFLCGLGASLTGRLLEGGFNARAVARDEIVERAYGSVSPGELAEITRQTQQRSLETLGKELTQFANELNERLDRGLQRIEQSTSRAASLVSQEQRGALHTVVQELSLSVRQGVEHHLAELRGALQRAVEHQGSVTSGLAETFERMVENAQTQDRVARTLIESASSVEEAARAMRSTAGEMQPVLDHLGSTSRSLSDTADRIGDTQQVVARTAEGVRSSLEFAADGVDDQRQFIERSLTEIRRALEGLGDGLGDSLQRSLREVDDVLGSTVGQLRDTLSESNETIERLAGPIRAAEGSTRETHVALDRVRNEVEALGQWMNQAVKPLRSGLTDVETRAEDITRAISEFTNHTRQIDKTMDSLRPEG
ncbi:MAG: methyl-accepting chemotaxis protein [Myxococcota bacterium]